MPISSNPPARAWREGRSAFLRPRSAARAPPDALQHQNQREESQGRRENSGQGVGADAPIQKRYADRAGTKPVQNREDQKQNPDGGVLSCD